MKSKIVNIITVFVALLTVFQGLAPDLPVSNPAQVTLISAITIFLVASLTAWKQALSVEINNKALMPTLIIAIVATMGGLNELFDVIPFSAITAQWLRFSITFVIAGLNIISKVLYPTDETKSLV